MELRKLPLYWQDLTQHTGSLPSGKKHFAIHKISDKCFH